MKAIPMKGRLTGKSLQGYIWAGLGASWVKKENYFQLEDDRRVSAVFHGSQGTFWIRFDGASCEITVKKNRRILTSAKITIPKKKK